MADFDRIEAVVCNCVNDVLRKKNSHEACSANLYAGRTKSYLEVTIARQFCYYVFHDLYHVAYSTISKRAGLSVRGVIHNTKKVRHLMFNDEVYKSISLAITKELG